MHNFIIPKVGMGITEVEISKWLVKIGDIVNVGEPIVEINTEKVTASLESDTKGKIEEILFNPGDMVEVGNVICRINEL